mmetsp:Transcript_68529/g.142873  ORF Transcript_68529/g.142873 Transcript_68529/m.142873 type:complete len:119 (+) Transcript_68529:73-429(+)|eukprot:CAMPEP_0181323360 /NCGR_PEP_ID=MMETSP1101-20121128/19742_1 /TAXON_ID=46948 /ORGANISM="Rhodomonas abbreviata, Strain Caron Lab Isolate" /LENGTH=118 /DNA_ID=CAMNT_0023431379 /DNA_START=64 /DNA_END=420 /DNA_ORIENTATION=+
MSEGFHPEKSRVNAGSLADFIRAPLTGSLQEVPGIGEATEKVMRENGISTTYGLIGKFLSLKEEGVEPVEHADRFYFWLKSIGTAGGFRAGVVHAIAEKMNATFVGIYDADAYGALDA